MQVKSRMLSRVSLLVAATIALSSQAAQSAEIKVIAANAIKGGYAELVSAFEKSSGHKVVTTWAGTVNATKRVNDGEVYDLVIIGSDNIDQLIKAGKLAAGSRTDFAKSGVAIAVRAGLPKPDISTSNAVKTAVLEAKSVSVLCRTERRLRRGVAQEDGHCRASRLQDPAAVVGRGGRRNIGARRRGPRLRAGERVLERAGPRRAWATPSRNPELHNLCCWTTRNRSLPDAAKALIQHLKAPGGCAGDQDDGYGARLMAFAKKRL